MSGQDEDPRVAENQRLLREYARREAEIPPERYAPWNPAESFMREGRRRRAARMLRRAGVFPGPQTRCLEVGYGRLGWLGDLVAWGVRETSLSGIELDEARGAEARRVLPAADLRLGDACEMPWGDGEVDLVIASTVFTSVLDDVVRRRLAGEIERVLAPGGALLWYDFRVNPRSSRVRAVGRRRLRQLFPGLAGEIASVTLAPPICRLVTPWSHWLAITLEALPLLRSHLLAVLVKPSDPP